MLLCPDTNGRCPRIGMKRTAPQEKLALQTSMAGLREQLRAKDEEQQSQAQSLAAMGAVSQASSHRLSAAEKVSEARTSRMEQAAWDGRPVGIWFRVNSVFCAAVLFRPRGRVLCGERHTSSYRDMVSVWRAYFCACELGSGRALLLWTVFGFVPHKLAEVVLISSRDKLRTCGVLFQKPSGV